jgi:hypothetical protein
VEVTRAGPVVRVLQAPRVIRSMPARTQDRCVENNMWRMLPIVQGEVDRFSVFRGNLCHALRALG